MSLINLFILSYFCTMVNKETIGVCVFLIYFMDGWGISTPYIKTDITQTCNKNTERHQSASIEHSSEFKLRFIIRTLFPSNQNGSAQRYMTPQVDNNFCWGTQPFWL